MPDSLEKMKPRQQEQQQHTKSIEEPSYSAKWRVTAEISLNPVEICLEANRLSRSWLSRSPPLHAGTEGCSPVPGDMEEVWEDPSSAESALIQRADAKSSAGSPGGNLVTRPGPGGVPLGDQSLRSTHYQRWGAQP